VRETEIASEAVPAQFKPHGFFSRNPKQLELSIASEEWQADRLGKQGVGKKKGIDTGHPWHGMQGVPIKQGCQPALINVFGAPKCG
jgi:hypothetical protein